MNKDAERLLKEIKRRGGIRVREFIDKYVDKPWVLEALKYLKIVVKDDDEYLVVDETNSS